MAFRDEVLGTFERHRQRRIWSAEAGGQLFARFEGGDVVIRTATGPRDGDRRTRFSLVVDRGAERREIAREHGRGLHFVGDWHTHPQRLPSPSGRDLASIVECFRRSDHVLTSMLLVIVGTAAFPAGLAVLAADLDGVRGIPVLA